MKVRMILLSFFPTIMKIKAFTISELLVSIIVLSIIVILFSSTILFLSKSNANRTISLNETQLRREVEDLLRFSFQNYSIDADNDILYITNKSDSGTIVLKENSIRLNTITVNQEIENVQVNFQGIDTVNGMLDFTFLVTAGSDEFVLHFPKLP